MFGCKRDKEYTTVEHCVKRNCMVCTPCIIIFGDQSKEEELGGAYGTYVRKDKGFQDNYRRTFATKRPRPQCPPHEYV
jgi:hypothetical protein